MQALGFNYRITDFQCALGLSQLTRLDDWIAQAQPRSPTATASCSPRRSGSPFRPRRPAGSLHGYHLFVDPGARRARRRACAAFEALRAAGIGVQVHYIPIYRHPYYRDALGYPQDECPDAEDVLRGRDLAADVPRDDGRRRRARRGRARAGRSRELRRGFERAFEIGGRRVGAGAPAYVIAEAGANHNRDLGLARELIDVAADAGADAVKFQTYTGQDLYSSKTPRFEYLEDERSPQELLDAIALPREWQPELAEHAATRGIAVLLDARSTATRSTARARSACRR